MRQPAIGTCRCSIRDVSSPRYNWCCGPEPRVVARSTINCILKRPLSKDVTRETTQDWNIADALAYILQFTRGEVDMCEYSLQLMASRPAKVGDKLVIAKFPQSITRGFCAVAEPSVAVCLQPGTELVFDDNVQYKRALSILPKIKLNGKTALFREISRYRRDAVEFPSGQVILLTRLCEGQRATVLQLPAPSSLSKEPADLIRESVTA
jgi:hypothetical protein